MNFVILAIDHGSQMKGYGPETPELEARKQAFLEAIARVLHDRHVFRTPFRSVRGDYAVIISSHQRNCLCGVCCMDRISESLLAEFSTEHGIVHLPEEKRFEHFAS